MNSNIMAEGFRFMSLSLVRLRTFRLMGYLGATWTHVFMHVRGANVSFRDVKAKEKEDKEEGSS